MKTITYEELKVILEKHGKWLRNEGGGERAILDDYDLSNKYLNGASLNYASLNGASLNGASLDGASLNYASLNYASLNYASLNDASLNYASLNYASLNYASLNGASLDGASLNGASLNYASLKGAKNVPFIPLNCPDSGSFIGWKKAGGKIVKLKIPYSAKRSSATSYKCRCDQAKVIAIENLDGTPSETKKVTSDYDEYFDYEVGKTVSVDNFDDNRWNECATGIHFFINRQSAVEY